MKRRKIYVRKIYNKINKILIKEKREKMYQYKFSDDFLKTVEEAFDAGQKTNVASIKGNIQEEKSLVNNDCSCDKRQLETKSIESKEIDLKEFGKMLNGDI